MFKVTIEAVTHEELVANLLELATGRRVKIEEVTPATEAPTKPARKAKAPTPQPEPEDAVVDTDGEGDDADLLAPAPPQPETAAQVVDAGTGKPAGAVKKAAAKSDEPIKMTFDDVKVAAAKLVAKDQAKLAEILGKYEAANLSGVPKESLGDFAADVMEALEA